MFRVEHSFMEVVIMNHRLFYIILHVMASVMAMFRGDYSSWKGVIMNSRLFYIPCLPASLCAMFRVDYSS